MDHFTNHVNVFEHVAFMIDHIPQYILPFIDVALHTNTHTVNGLCRFVTRSRFNFCHDSLMSPLSKSVTGLQLKVYHPRTALFDPNFGVQNKQTNDIHRHL